MKGPRQNFEQLWKCPVFGEKVKTGFDAVGKDITEGADFLGQAPETGVTAIITNPPYALA
jgi:hypothetical protein